jgi:hypothetical protein
MPSACNVAVRVPQFSAGILAEVLHRDVPQIDLGKRHRSAIDGGLRCIVHVVDEHAHPLLARAVRIHRTARLSGGLDLDTLIACLGLVPCVDAANHQVGMAIEIAVDGQRARVLGKARRDHVGQQAGHDRGSQSVVQPIQSLGDQAGVHVVEKVVDILHGKPDVVDTELIGQVQAQVEFRCVGSVSNNRHRRRSLRLIGYSEPIAAHRPLAPEFGFKTAVLPAAAKLRDLFGSPRDSTWPFPPSNWTVPTRWKTSTRAAKGASS